MKTTADRLAQRLEAALGGDSVKAEPALRAAYIIDGKLPTLICTPDTPEQIGAALKICSELDATVVPWGGGTAMAIGNPPRYVDLVITTNRLNKVLDHDDANLTATVQSGIALDTLQALLAPQKQFVPFDPPFCDRSTIGGIVAANLNGPRRGSYGSVRDLVIGMKVVLASGEQIKAGGKVVKNVAGYDMCKLFTGSLGTLGIITEATLRMAPIPQTAATITASGTLTEAVQLTDELSRANLSPTSAFLLAGRGQPAWRFAVGFEGFEETVSRQLRDLRNLAQSNGIQAESLRDEQHHQVWREIRNFSLQDNRVIFRVTVPRASVAKVVQTVRISRTTTIEPVIIADIATGTVWIASEANKSLANHFADLISLAQQHHGHAVMFAASPDSKIGIEAWGPSTRTLSLMREIKQQFDPKGLLNPGRFIGGL
jgi:glycolate oxidase FAD binding subunit